MGIDSLHMIDPMGGWRLKKGGDFALIGHHMAGANPILLIDCGHGVAHPLAGGRFDQSCSTDSILAQVKMKPRL